MVTSSNVINQLNTHMNAVKTKEADMARLLEENLHREDLIEPAETPKGHGLQEKKDPTPTKTERSDDGAGQMAFLLQATP